MLETGQLLSTCINEETQNYLPVRSEQRKYATALARLSHHQVVEADCVNHLPVGHSYLRTAEFKTPPNRSQGF